MSARMQFPLSQRRHTNIAVVRYTRNGVKLEIACYKNKVISYRSGTEHRLDEVLQVERVFSNVARGLIAPEKDIAAVFGAKTTEQEAIRYILLHGDLQVAQHERTCEVDEMFKDIALIITQKCINEQTQRPFPSQVVEQALRSIGAAVKLDQPIKKQALSLMHQLIDSRVIPIARANMKLRCNTNSCVLRDRVEQWCREHGADILERRGSGITSAMSTNSAANGETDQSTDSNHTDENMGDVSVHRVERLGGNTSSYIQSTLDTPHSSTHSCSLLIAAKPHLYRELDTFIKEHLPAKCATLQTVETAMTVGVEEDGESVGMGDSMGATLTPMARHRPAPAQSPLAAHIRDGNSEVAASSTKQHANKQSSEVRKATHESEEKCTHRDRERDMEEDAGDEEDGGAHKDGQRCAGSNSVVQRNDGRERMSGNGVSDTLEAVAAELKKLGLDLDSDVRRDAAKKQTGKKAGVNKSSTSGGGHSDSTTGSATMSSTTASKRVKKNAKKGAVVVPNPSAQSATKRDDTPENSDDELECNRRQRKNAKAKDNAATHNNHEYNSEDEFDYGEEDDGSNDE